MMSKQNDEGPVQKKIRTLLGDVLTPIHLEVENESHTHSVPAGSETHFRVFVVSTKFESLSRVARQRLVNDALKDLFASGLHALSQKTLTPLEWSELGADVEFSSPPCIGAKKTN
jgi:stress-induced morphogen